MIPSIVIRATKKPLPEPPAPEAMRFLRALYGALRPLAEIETCFSPDWGPIGVAIRNGENSSCTLAEEFSEQEHDAEKAHPDRGWWVLTFEINEDFTEKTREIHFYSRDFENGATAPNAVLQKTLQLFGLLEGAEKILRELEKEAAVS